MPWYKWGVAIEAAESGKTNAPDNRTDSFPHILSGTARIDKGQSVITLYCPSRSSNSFSAIAPRSVMISHQRQNALLRQHQCFSAIARSVMISPLSSYFNWKRQKGFSAIARSVMISPATSGASIIGALPFQCYSS